jgi:hypothetical protein
VRVSERQGEVTVLGVKRRWDGPPVEGASTSSD